MCMLALHMILFYFDKMFMRNQGETLTAHPYLDKYRRFLTISGMNR